MLQPKTRSDEDLRGWQRSSLRPLPRQAEKVTHWWQGENFRLLICLSLVIPVTLEASTGLKISILDRTSLQTAETVLSFSGGI